MKYMTLDLAVNVFIGAIFFALALVFIERFAGRWKCTHRNRGTYVEETAGTVEKTVSVCLNCGKKLKTTYET